nr:germin-like protein 5-1 [Ipomoea batatas]
MISFQHSLCWRSRFASEMSVLLIPTQGVEGEWIRLQEEFHGGDFSSNGASEAGEPPTTQWGPWGLVHFQKNNGDVSGRRDRRVQQPSCRETQSIAAALFAGVRRLSPDDVLTKAFQVGTKEVEKIKSRLAPKK